MPTIAVNGFETNYRFDGPEGAPVILFSNSLMSDLTMWNAQVAVLSADYRCLRYDTRGHGGSAAPEGRYSMEILANDVLGLLDALGLDKVHYVGLSLGGFIGQEFAATHGDRLLSLTLCDTTASQDGKEQMWEDRIKDALDSGLDPLVEPALKRWFTPAFHENDPGEVDRIRKICHEVSVGGYVGCCGAIADMDLRAKLADISAATLVMVGSDDPSTSVDKAEFLRDNITRATMHVIQDAAHLSNVEQPEDFTQNLSMFLTKVAG